MIKLTMLKPLPDRLASIGRWVACVIAAILLTVALHAVIPPLFIGMVALRILATEGGIWIAIVGVITALIALLIPSRKRLKSVTTIMALGAGFVGVMPLFMIPTTISQADSALARVCGPFWSEHLPALDRHEVRAHAYAIGDAIVGFSSPPVIETDVAIPGADGVVLSGTRYQGPGEGRPQPVIIAMHGGGWSGGSVTEGAACHRYLAAHGYLVYSVAYRLAPATPFPGALDDVQAARIWVTAHAAKSGGDRSRLILMGRSAGAQLALVAAYERPDPSIRAVVSWYGPVDLVKGYREPPRPDPLQVRGLLRDYLKGTPENQTVAYARASPISYATRALPPTLLIAAVADHGVLIGFQRQLRDRLEATGTPVVLLELPWAEHAFDRIPNGPGAQMSLYYLERFLAWAVSR